MLLVVVRVIFRFAAVFFSSRYFSSFLFCLFFFLIQFFPYFDFLLCIALSHFCCCWIVVLLLCWRRVLYVCVCQCFRKRIQFYLILFIYKCEKNKKNEIQHKFFFLCQNTPTEKKNLIFFFVTVSMLFYYNNNAHIRYTYLHIALSCAISFDVVFITWSFTYFSSPMFLACAPLLPLSFSL